MEALKEDKNIKMSNEEEDTEEEKEYKLLDNKIKAICKSIRDEEEVSKSKLDHVTHLFERDWIKIMTYSGLYNKACFTYSLNNIKFKDYGIKCDIYIVPPLTFSKLDEVKDMLEEALGCMIIMNHARASRWINAKFVFNQFDTKEFEVVKLKHPFILYIGNDYSGKPILVNLKDYPHLLVSGGTRSGKSKMEDCIITCSAVNFKPSQLQLYLCQAAKSDLVLYEDLVHTRAFADSLEKIKAVLRYITDTVMPDRDKLIRPYRKRAMADNYHDYNKLKGTIDIPTTLIIFDEMSSLYQISGEGGDEKILKQEITELIDRIAQYGSALGCFLISSVQRPTAKNLSPFVKSQSTANVSMRQNNSKSAEVATDDPKLPLGLKQREFVYHLDRWDYGIVPYIKNKEIYNYLKPYFDPKHRTLFDDLKKQQHRDGVKKDKIKMENVESNFKTEEDILNENISKIKGYVPYDNHTGCTVVDEKAVAKRNVGAVEKSTIYISEDYEEVDEDIDNEGKIKL